MVFFAKHCSPSIFLFSLLSQTEGNALDRLKWEAYRMVRLLEIKHCKGKTKVNKADLNDT